MNILYLIVLALYAAHIPSTGIRPALQMAIVLLGSVKSDNKNKRFHSKRGKHRLA